LPFGQPFHAFAIATSESNLKFTAKEFESPIEFALRQCST
jgi:hypothetical protein